MTSHFLYACIWLSEDRLYAPNAVTCWNPLHLSTIENQASFRFFSPGNLVRKPKALNSHLNCVHFSLTSSEISAADTKEVLKACFDSNRLDSVVFFHSKLKLFIAGEKNPLRVYWVVVVWAMHVLLSLWKHECLCFTLKMKRRRLSCPKSCHSVLLYNSV